MRFDAGWHEVEEFRKHKSAILDIQFSLEAMPRRNRESREGAAHLGKASRSLRISLLVAESGSSFFLPVLLLSFSLSGSIRKGSENSVGVGAKRGFFPLRIPFQITQ